MPPPFYHLTVQEFARALDRFPFTRRVNAVHMHHTWRPDHREYRGHDSIVAMWRYHTQVSSWSDMPQHITIAPDGTIWSGRNWDRLPVSASGHNGNRTAGPFMFAMIGDFGFGRDPFEGKQREAAIQVIVLIQKKFNLPAESLLFHRQMSARTCPGDSIDYNEILRGVRTLLASTKDLERMADRVNSAGAPFDETALASHALIQSFSRDAELRDDPPDAEPHEDAMSDAQMQALFAPLDASRSTAAEAGAARDGQREARIPPEVLNSLRPHVINLSQGKFTSTEQYETTPGDVDAIFDDYLVRELEGAKARREPLRLLFYAHGGLVKESAGLRIAEKHVSWWKKNYVYPIYFTWETGLFETVGQLLRRSRQAVSGATRDIFDYTTDPALEELARALYGPRVWSGMKLSAEQAVGNGGGALYVAEKLKAFCDAHQAKLQDNRDLIELHAAGHSAGSIFHSHFIPKAASLGAPSFRTAHFLAPAIRVDAFLDRLGGLLGEGKGVDHLTIFTMSKSHERADNCAGVYRKSLLYLIYEALEAERKTPILGLEVSLRENPRLKELFGLGAARSRVGEVIWSTTLLDSGRGASRAIHHGDFDDDAATMNSVLRRVVGADDNDPIKEFSSEPAGQRGLGSWDNQVDWPEGMGFLFAVTDQPEPLPALPLSTPAPPSAVTPGWSAPQPTGAGRRRALCVGINQYPTAPLYGCVADAQSWQATLNRIGFSDVTVLTDQQATRDAILGNLTQLVATSGPGDVVVFQYAGHGTQLPDVDNDEAGGDTPELDEAICPVDFAEGHFLIDDDIGRVFDQIPAGVNLTCFIDCCHSGTISRFGVGATNAAGGGRQGPIPRFVVVTPQMIEAHRQFRRRNVAARAAGRRGLSVMREVLFAACLSHEVAYENAGHGDFTARATRLLQAGLGGSTNEQFEERVIAEFGSAAVQHPRLYCRPEVKSSGLLQPVAGRNAGQVDTGGRNISAQPGMTDRPTAQLLRTIASILEGHG